MFDFFKKKQVPAKPSKPVEYEVGIVKLTFIELDDTKHVGTMSGYVSNGFVTEARTAAVTAYGHPQNLDSVTVSLKSRTVMIFGRQIKRIIIGKQRPHKIWYRPVET